mmetsp:Transcript_22783/g.37492  ORF Transcript_22783/g.37492 Transcript_22783/m.37492 type:complete len:708 (+) Transcript_22783:69-2192(+)
MLAALIGYVKSLRIPPKKEGVFVQIIVLGCIYVLAFAVRLFSILRYESVIHEFDPYFNFRTTKFLVNEGFYKFLNWFDDESWYPLGRIIGGTVYPGLMYTAAILYWILNGLSLTVNIRNVCVLTAPFFASNTAIVTYLFGKELRDVETGLVAAALIAVVPGYISRSVAGSFDNEGVAIFALLQSFYLFVKAVNTGSLFWALMASLAYLYMASAWGGYIFIINIIPIYVLILIISGRYSNRLYVAYTTLYVMGTILSMQIRFIGFQAVQSSEHMAALGVFGLLQVYQFVVWVRTLLPPDLFRRFFKVAFTAAGTLFAVAAILGQATGYISPWTGRFYSLLDPTYAKEHIPIIASVSEHQPTTWSSFFFDLHLLVFLFPAGLYFCFRKLTDANIFIILYGITSVYFAGVMVRLMLVLAPAACLLSAIAVSATLKTYMGYIKKKPEDRKGDKKAKFDPNAIPMQKEISYVLVGSLALLLFFYTFHCTWVTSEAYSSPSIVLAAKQSDGSRIIFDDFRESYYWLRQNTPPDAKIMSWWDYGYQITAMGNRTIIVDNNTWNNTHIATVGRAMASREEDAIKIMRMLDVTHVLVVFGGLTGYASDDINKFLWMVRIGGGVFPVIKESEYLTPNGDFRVDKEGTPAMLNSLMYKMCYYRFGQTMTEYGKPTGYDRVRNVEIGNKDFELQYIEEAFTTTNWIVRIYKVKPEANRW